VDEEQPAGCSFDADRGVAPAFVLLRPHVAALAEIMRMPCTAPA
jgi:hypothetical protein